MANPCTARSSVFLERAKLALGMQWQIMTQTSPFSFHQERRDLVRCKGSLSTRCSTIKVTARAPKRFTNESQTSKKVLGLVFLGISKHSEQGAAVDFEVLGYYWRMHRSVDIVITALVWNCCSRGFKEYFVSSNQTLDVLNCIRKSRIFLKI